MLTSKLDISENKSKNTSCKVSLPDKQENTSKYTSRLLPTPDMFGFILFSLVSIGLSSQCEISVKNVGQVCCSGGNSKHLYFVVQKNFVWHISYAGNFDYEKELGPQDHDNYSCSCVPHDMEIRMPVSPELSPKISVNL